MCYYCGEIRIMSKIEWTDKTWNPTTGCNKVSSGCKNCYAEVMHKRMMTLAPKKYTKEFSAGVQTHEDELTKPLRWKKPQRIFVNSMSDLFHEDVHGAFIDFVFATMALCPQHTFQILTKRPQRMMELLTREKVKASVWHIARMNALRKLGKDWFSDSFEWPLPNVWLGTSCENQQTADERIPFLLQTPAALHFISCEPLLGEIDLEGFLPPNERLERPNIDWVIAGGESGPGARPMHPDWVRSLRDQCNAAGVKFFFKQWGEWMPASTEPYKFMLAQLSQINNKKYKNWCAKKVETIDECRMIKVGKKASGHLLDGVEHREFPKTEKI